MLKAVKTTRRKPRSWMKDMLYEFADMVDPRTMPAKLTDLKWHIAGFIDGDGSFPVVLSPDPGKRFGWLIQPRFQVELRETKDSLTMLEVIRRAIGIKSKILRGGGYAKLIVTNRRLLLEKVIPFFTRYRPALKHDEFNLLKYVTEALEAKKHLEYGGFKEIVKRVFALPTEGEARRKWYYADIITGEEEPAQSARTRPKFPTGSDLRHYVAGFTDAEGCFGYAVNERARSITPYLTIAHRETEVLRAVQRALRCGNISAGRLQVYGMEEMSDKVIPFFKKHPLIAKRTTYQEFRKILELILADLHKKDIDKVIEMIRSLNKPGDPQRPYAGHPPAKDGL